MLTLWLLSKDNIKQNNLFSTFCFVPKDEDGDAKGVSEMLVEKLPIFVQSADLEVQERVSDSCKPFPLTRAMKRDCNFIDACNIKCHQCKFQRQPLKAAWEIRYNIQCSVLSLCTTYGLLEVF